MPAQERLTSVTGHLKPSGVSEGKARILEKSSDDIVGRPYSSTTPVLTPISTTGHNISDSNGIDESSERWIQRLYARGFVDFHIKSMLVLFRSHNLTLIRT